MVREKESRINPKNIGILMFDSDYDKDCVCIKIEPYSHGKDYVTDRTVKFLETLEDNEILNKYNSVVDEIDIGLNEAEIIIHDKNIIEKVNTHLDGFDPEIDCNYVNRVVNIYVKDFIRELSTSFNNNN